MSRVVAAVSVSGVLAGALPGAAAAGVVHRVTLGGEITYVGDVVDTPLGHNEIQPRETERWSLTVLLDAASPDLLGPELTVFGSSILSGALTMDDHEMALAFAGGGIEVSSAQAGTLTFDAGLMGELALSVFAEGLGVDPALGLPTSLDPLAGSRARFAISDQASRVLVAGTFDGYTLETIVPAPGAAALLGLAALGATRRRR